MYEHILRAAIRRDETKTLGRVEEFYGAGLGHWGRTPSPVFKFSGPLSVASSGRSGSFIGGHALSHEYAPRQGGAVRDLQCRGKGRSNVPVSGSANARTS